MTRILFGGVQDLSEFCGT